MNLPRIGVSLPTFGPHAGPDSIRTVATAVDALGFHTVSASERLLLPAHAGWENNFDLPDSPVLDPIEALTWAAACTSRVRLCTAVVNALFQPPIILARRLATLDVLSGGRLDAGLGQGWLSEEFVATGVPESRRGSGFEEHLAAMQACWNEDPVEHDGPRYRIPTSKVGPKPVNGAIPLLIGAGSQAAIERAARLGAGVMLATWDWELTRTDIDWYRNAGGAGPLVLLMVRRWEHAESTGVDTIAKDMLDDLHAAAGLGANEVRWELNLSDLDPHRQVSVLEALANRLPSAG